MTEQKRILVVAMQKPTEALRMASGLTLLDDAVTVVAWGQLPEGPDVAEQREALDFADVPIVELDPAGDGVTQLAQRLLEHDVVYCV